MGQRHLPAGLLLAWMCLAAPPSNADEARPRAGRPVAGTLRLIEGRLRFVAADGSPPLAAADIERVRLDVPPPPSFPGGFVVRAHFDDGQQITGQLLDLDGEDLHLRTAWTDRLAIPRAALASLTGLPGWRMRFADDFTAGLSNWKAAGKPTLATTPPAVVFDAAGSELALTLAEPIGAGRLGVNFTDRHKAHGGRWDFEALFGSTVLRVTVAGQSTYAVDLPGIGGEAHTVTPTPGLHRLVVQFTSRSMRVLCDAAVLWYSLEHGPPGPLREVRLQCRPNGTAAPTGSVAFSDFTVEEAVEERPRPGGDATQDEVWLYDGDQWFGKIARADRRGVELHGGFGRRSVGWDRIRGCWFRRSSTPPRSSTGAHVRLEVASGLDPQKDSIEGVLRSWDAREALLEHPLLGELHLPRASVRSLWPLLDGRRIELDNGFHHLGESGRLDARIDPPRAEGLSWRGEFRLDAVPDDARLVLGVVPPPSAALEGAGTAVVVNGRRVGYLNGQANGATGRPGQRAIALPRDALRLGANEIELKQTSDPKTGRIGHCGIFGMAVEIPERTKGASP
jgi:hypothetical protein